MKIPGRRKIAFRSGSPNNPCWAEALRKAEIQHELHVLEDMPHAFMQMWMLSGCVEGQRLMFNFIKRHLQD